MVQNVSEPTYFGSGHVLNSKLVSESFKQFCFCCKINHKHDRNFIEHNFRHFFKTLHQGSYTRISRIPALVNRRYIQVSTQHF